VLVVFVIVLFTAFKKEPTCSDGIKNQNESGIDCGGPCSVLCRAEYVSPNILWTAKSKITTSGNYNILVYAENPNINVGSYNTPYSVKLYDKENVLLYSTTSSTYIPPSSRFVIYIDGINIGDKVPVRIDFKLSSGIVWQTIESGESGIVTTAKDYSDSDVKPKLSVSLKNTTLSQIKNIEAVAILYDIDSNAFAFSRTKIDKIEKGDTSNIVFTWPEKFTKEVSLIDVVYKILPK